MSVGHVEMNQPFHHITQSLHCAAKGTEEVAFPGRNVAPSNFFLLPAMNLFEDFATLPIQKIVGMLSEATVITLDRRGSQRDEL